MRIGIDVDDTITDTRSYVYLLKKKYYKEYDADELLPQDIFNEFINKYERDIHKNVPLKSGAKDALGYLANAGHEIFIMSSRGSGYNKVTEHTAYDDTLEYFNKNNLPYKQIIVNLRDKKKAILSNNIDLFIDDSEKVCRSLRNTEVKVIKMARPDDKDDSLFTLANWQEIIEYIKEKIDGENNNE